MLEADPALLRQVMLNLIGNALKYTRTRKRARIEISSSHNANERIICIRDNGVGFDMRYRDKLFGVFHRLHRADEFAGYGLGLATVQRIIDKHGGRVWAEAGPGKGAELAKSGATALPQVRHEKMKGKIDIEIPVNTGGGLIGDGHPVGATGVRQVVEAYQHLTGQAGARQIENVKRFLTFNMGGSLTTSVAMIWGRD